MCALMLMLVLTSTFTSINLHIYSVFASHSVDFAIEWLEPTRAQYLVGETVDIGVGIRNTGTEEIEAYDLEASLSLISPDGQKIFVGYDWNGWDIPPGNSWWFEFKWVIPSTAKGGWYDCEVSITHKPTPFSKTMTKNDLFQVIISTPDIDLVGEIYINGIKYANKDTAYISGTSANVKFVVLNLGTQYAQGFNVRYRYYVDQLYTEEKRYSGLSPGSTITFEKTLTNLKQGLSYHAHMTIDYLGEVAEKNETNNDYVVFIKIGKLASTFQISLLQSTITSGSHIIIEGSISPIPQSSFYTDVFYTRPDGSSVKHQTFHQGNRSSFTVDYYTPDMLGTWSVYAVWYGNSELEGATSNTLTFQVTSEGFTLATHPTMIGLYQGQQGQVTVNVESASPQPYSVTLSVHGLPSHTNYYFNASSGNPPFSARLTIETSSNTPPGEYTITIKGVGGGYESQVTFILNIYPLTQPELYSLPARALVPPGDSLIDRALLTSVSPGQTITASAGQTISLTVGYQIWQGSNPSEIDQMFLLYSWSPSWPPPSGYYAEIYNSIPPSYPGTTGTKQISITLPTTPGTYYIWVGWCAHYSVPQAVQGFTSKPSLPAHIKIIVQATTDVAPSQAPSLVSPPNGASLSVSSVTFSWNSVSEATRYELYISGPVSYDIVDITGTSYTLSLSASGSYTWKVRGYNSAGYGPWSPSWSFTLNLVKFYDLAIESVELSDSKPDEGELVTIKFTVKNLGNEPSNEWAYSLFYNVSFTEPITVKRVENLIESETLAPLGPGESKIIETSFIARQVVNSENSGLCIKLWEIGGEDANEANNKACIHLNINGLSFRMDRDAYSFPNWEFSPEDLKDLRRQLEIALKDYPLSQILLAIIYPVMASAGHCFGMASTSILYYTKTISKPVDKETFYMTKEEAAPNIAAYHVTQWPYILRVLVQEKLDSIFGYNLTREYEKIKEILSKGKLPLMLIRLTDGKNTYGHAVTVFDIYDLNEDQKIVITYDNNVNGISTPYTFILSNNLIFCDYMSRKGYSIKSIYIDEPAPYISDVIKKIIEDFIKAIIEHGKRIISFGSPVNVIITDEYGRKISQDLNEIPGAYVEYYNFTETKIFYLPANLTYMVSISATDYGNCTITNIMPLSHASLAYSQLTFNLSPSTTSYFSLHPDTSDYYLQIDEDLSGTIDQQITPETAYYQITETKDYPITIYEQEFHVSIQSNSTITDFNFYQNEKAIKFYTSGISNAVSFINVSIPKMMLKGEPWTVMLNGTSWDFTLTQNETHSFIHFTYTQASTYEITIQGTWVIPEYPSTLILASFLLITLIVTILRKTKRKTKYNFPFPFF
ncbi:MAG: CARDB domain-containing protein [Candidatus Bathyarchaeia archaeon]